MATLTEINTELVTEITEALTAAGITSVSVGSEWPSKEALQDVGNGGPAIVAVIHRTTPYQRRNMRFEHSRTVNPVSIQSTVSDFSIAPGQSITITLAFSLGSTAVNRGDIVSCALVNGDRNNSVSYTAPHGASLNSMATGLAAVINSSLSPVLAVAHGAVVTVTNGSTAGYHISSNVGNAIQIAEAIMWADSSMQINCWSGDLATKGLIRDTLVVFLAGLDDKDGFSLPSCEWVKFRLHTGKPIDADTDKDVFTDLFLFTIEYMIDEVFTKYVVVATSPQLP